MIFNVGIKSNHQMRKRENRDGQASNSHSTNQDQSRDQNICKGVWKMCPVAERNGFTEQRGTLCLRSTQSAKNFQTTLNSSSNTALLFSCFSHVWLFPNPTSAAHQASLSMGFPRQEYRSGLPFPSPGDCPNPGIEPECPALAGRFFTAEPLMETLSYYLF